MTPQACDRCHQAKEKCSFTSEADKCFRCQKIGCACCVSRKAKRKGRRPVLRSYSHGKIQLWEPELASDTTGPNILIMKRSHDAVDVCPPKRTMQTTYRPHGSGLFGSIVEHMSRERFLEQLQSRLSPNVASEAVRVLTDDERFVRVHIPFVVGRSFLSDFRVAIHSVMYDSASEITDGYLAFLGLVANCQSSCLSLRAPDLRRGAKALETLQRVEIGRPQDALCALLLGQALYVFAALIGSYPISAHSIVQNALMSARPWYSELSRVPAFDTVTLCPALLDIVGCLVHREVPVLKILNQDRTIVDRYVGLCSTLLPHLHLLCEQSHAALFEEMEPPPTSTHPSCVTDRYTLVESDIRLWQPQALPELLIAYDKKEINLMIAQARAYRLASLLIIHRLRFPLGVHDDIGENYARAIFDNIRNLIQTDIQRDSGLGAFPIAFPLFLSMLEIEGPGEEMLEHLRVFPIQSICIIKLQGFIKHVRMLRQSGYQGLWFDLVKDNLAHNVIP